MTQEELQAQFELAVRIRDKVSEANDGVSELRSVCRQADEWAGRAKDGPGEQPVADAARALKKALTAIEEELVEPRADGALNRLNYPVKLVIKLGALTSVVTNADAPPTKQAYEVYDHLAGLIDATARTAQGDSGQPAAGVRGPAARAPGAGRGAGQRAGGGRQDRLMSRPPGEPGPHVAMDRNAVHACRARLGRRRSRYDAR